MSGQKRLFLNLAFSVVFLVLREIVLYVVPIDLVHVVMWLAICTFFASPFLPKIFYRKQRRSVNYERGESEDQDHVEEYKEDVTVQVHPEVKLEEDRVPNEHEDREDPEAHLDGKEITLEQEDLDLMKAVEKMVNAPTDLDSLVSSPPSSVFSSAASTLNTEDILTPKKIFEREINDDELIGFIKDEIKKETLDRPMDPNLIAVEKKSVLSNVKKSEEGKLHKRVDTPIPSVGITKDVETVDAEFDSAALEETGELSEKSESESESKKEKKRRKKEEKKRRKKEEKKRRKKEEAERSGKNKKEEKKKKKKKKGNPFDRTKLEVGAAFSSGAYGIVKKGVYVDNGITTEVAIKEIKVMNQKELKMVQHEIEIHAKLRHDNVLKCFGYWFDGTKGCVVSELCDMDLAKFKVMIRQNPKMKLKAHNIIHRDLKCQNILITKDRKAKICDFGASKRVDSFKQSFVGTVEFIAPEIVLSAAEESGGLDFEQPSKLDVYAYGIIMWEIWTGRQPFRKLRKKIPNPYPFLREIHFNQRRPSLKKVKEMPMSVQKLMCECWSHQPGERPTFEVIAKKLKKIIKKEKHERRSRRKERRGEQEQEEQEEEEEEENAPEEEGGDE